MKKLMTFVFMSLLVLTSCSQAIEEMGGQNSSQSQSAQQTRTVTLSLTRSSDDNAEQADIKEVSIYVYQQVDRKTDALVYSKTLQLGDGNLQVDLPLGESLHTFVVANASSITDTESLSTVKINLDPTCSDEIYISDIVDFKSDYTTSNVDVTLHRLVGEVVLEPTEEQATLASFGKFDKVDVTFTNLATSYLVQSKEVEVSDVTLATDLSKGYQARAYSFPSAPAGTSTGVTYKMYRGAAVVNQTAALVDAGIVFEPSKRYTVKVPLTDEEYLESAWDASAKAHTRAAAKKSPVSVIVTDF